MKGSAFAEAIAGVGFIAYFAWKVYWGYKEKRTEFRSFGEYSASEQPWNYRVSMLLWLIALVGGLNFLSKAILRIVNGDL